MHRPRFVLASLLAIGLITGCRSTPATPAARAVSADTWATVNGHEITRADVDKAYQRTGNASQPLAEEEVLAAKLSLLDDVRVGDDQDATTLFRK